MIARTPPPLSFNPGTPPPTPSFGSTYRHMLGVLASGTLLGVCLFGIGAMLHSFWNDAAAYQGLDLFAVVFFIAVGSFFAASMYRAWPR